MEKWNGNRFSIYASEEKNVLGLIEELGGQTNANTDALVNKTDLTGDHKGSWQGLSKPTLSDEGMRATVEKHEKEIEELKNYSGENIFNIKNYGAIGDGLTDNTNAFIKAFSEIPNNSTLIIPNGEYIVYKDNNGATQGNSVLLNECLLLKNKENITIIGEGNVLIRPNGQGVSASKKRFPCTISIDQCKNIVMKNVNVESKGESYGDADAGFNLEFGDARTNFNIQNGGSALHISRSKNVKVYDGEFRLCGSCGVVYFSSVSSCGIYNSFSNPSSLGYASFAVDTWVDVSSNYDNTVEIIGCNTWAETIIRDGKIVGSTQYSSKSGIGVEGDSKIVKCLIKDCIIKDAYANGSDNYLGMGIFTYNAETTIINNLIENCAYAVYKRDTLTNDGKVEILNNTFNNLFTNGIVVKDLYSINHNKEDVISGNIINVKGDVLWTGSGLPHLAHSHGICIAEVRNGKEIRIENNNINVINGVGVAKHYKSSIKVSNNTILSKNSCVDMYGGGDNTVTNNTLKILSNSNNDVCMLYINTSSIDNSIFDTTRTIITGNSFIGDKPIRQTIQIISTNIGGLFVDKGIKNNSFTDCTFNLNKSNYKIKSLNSPSVKLVSKDGLMGEYTTLKFDFTNNITVNEFKVVDNEGIIRNCIFNAINETDWTEVIMLVSGDVRNKFTNEKYYTLL